MGDKAAPAGDPAAARRRRGAHLQDVLNLAFRLAPTGQNRGLDSGRPATWAELAALADLLLEIDASLYPPPPE